MFAEIIFGIIGIGLVAFGACLFYLVQLKRIRANEAKTYFSTLVTFLLLASHIYDYLNNKGHQFTIPLIVVFALLSLAQTLLLFSHRAEAKEERLNSDYLELQ